MKLGVWIALAAALVVGALLLWRRPHGVDPAAPSEPVAAAEATQALPEELPTLPARPSEPSLVARADDEPLRQAIPAPESTPDAKTSVTLVRLQIVSKDDGTPVAGERVSLRDPTAESWGARHIEGSRAGLGEAAVTDASGRAELEVEPGVSLGVYLLARHVWAEGGEIAALAQGEQREVRVEIPTLPDIRLCGRLVDAESGQAVPGGVVRLDMNKWKHRGGDAGKTLARVDGTFEIQARSWEARFASASGQEHARRIFRLEAGHESPDRALEVRLHRASTLEVLVLDGGSAVADAKLVLTTPIYHLRVDTESWDFLMGEEPEWTASTDLSGLAVVNSLPPRVPLELAVQPRGRARRVEAETLSLEPGELRRLEIRLGSGGTLFGRVEDAKGQAVPDLAIWRIPAEYPAPKRIESHDKPAASTRTDAQGRFRFEDVPAGAWHVGPPSISSWDQSKRTADALAALAQYVEVEGGSVGSEIVIRVQKGLYLSGSVVDAEGRPAPEITVWAQSQESFEHLHDSSDAEGRFRIGPLSERSYQLTAGGFGQGSHAPSEPVLASAGESNLTLRLRVGGIIRGRTLDAAGKLQRCELMLVREGEQGWVGKMSDGSFVFEGLLPGVYGLNARLDGLCGRRGGLLLRQGATLEGIDVVLELGARLRLTFVGEQSHWGCEILVEGMPFSMEGFERGKVTVVTVPAGEIELRWGAFGAEVEKTQRLTVAAGEERSVTWDGGE